MPKNPSNDARSVYLDKTREFFDRDICQRATKPLRDGIDILISVDGSDPFVLTRKSKQTEIEDRSSTSPDMTLEVPVKAIDHMLTISTEDIGELGVEILKLMTHTDSSYKIKVKLHVGLFNFLRNGYLGILPLGGATVMKFLSSRGLTGLGKIKDAIGRLRS